MRPPSGGFVVFGLSCREEKYFLGLKNIFCISILLDYKELNTKNTKNTLF